MTSDTVLMTTLAAGLTAAANAATLQPSLKAEEFSAPYTLVHKTMDDASVYVSEAIGAADTLAGINHIFVVGADSADWIAGFPEAPARYQFIVKNDLPAGYELGFDGEGTALFGAGMERLAQTKTLDFNDVVSSVRNATRHPHLAHYNLDSDDPAIEGYDPVSYFDDSPKKGDEVLTSEYRGVTYHFANRGNRARFAANPEAFAPAYGGWCATALADDNLVDINPESYLIEDGELLLFYDGFWGDARKTWLKKKSQGIKADADRGWEKTVSK